VRIQRSISEFRSFQLIESLFTSKENFKPTDSTIRMKKMLLAAAKGLCEAFAQGKPISELLGFFTEHEAIAIEHGHPSIAPWLGQEYIGHKEIGEYFQMISDNLSFENMKFGEWFVDEDKFRVGVNGDARWTFKETGKSWDEKFTYVLDYAEGETEREPSVREVKLRKYAVWADSGAVSPTPTLQ